MKKLLLASTVLAASSGVAFAEMSVTGSAEIGIFGGDVIDPTDPAYGNSIETQFHTDVDVTFTGTGETDGGLAFGFSIDLDESDGNPSAAFDPNTEGGETIFISGNFGTLTWGDTDGALDWAMQEVNIVGGSIADDETAHAGFSGNSVMDGFGSNGGANSKDGQIVRYEYAFSQFEMAASVELDDTGVTDPTIGVGGRFNAALGGVDLGIGIGYQVTGNGPGNADSSALGLSVDGTFANGLSAAFNYTSFDTVFVNGVGVDSHIGLGVGYSAGAISVGFNYGVWDVAAAGADDVTGWGLAAGYDLGGGAEILFGYGTGDLGNNAPPANNSASSFSLGVAMSF